MPRLEKPPTTPEQKAAKGYDFFALRGAKGWSQQTAAVACGVSLTTWRYWEMAKSSPSFPVALRVCRAFEGDVTMADLGYAFPEPAAKTKKTAKR